MLYSILKSTKQKLFNKNIFGFDIETYDKNKKFYCASIWHENPEFCKTFFNKDDTIDYFKTKKFRNSYIAATNLAFDFFGTFHKEEAMSKFNTLFRGSNLLYAKTYLNNKEFHRKYHNSGSLKFIDTMNYAIMSVEDMGKQIGIKKMDKPACIGRLPNNKQEKQEMLIYNMRDSEISARGLRFLFDTFQGLGATPKDTVAATAMSLFKNKYLNKDYFRHSVPDLDMEMASYFGGRTEVFQRGIAHNLYYYDFNSMYPDVMRNQLFPDPNTLRKTTKNTLEYIYEYEGISHVDIYCPYMEYPLLPYRTDNKLLFPIGDFSGWYTHIELRKAKEIGYTIKRVNKTLYFKGVCEPFRDYVDDLYKLRLDYKKNKNPMEIGVKLLLNSLYGKFGQKYRDRDNMVPVPDTYEEFQKLDIYERIGDYFRVKKEFSEPSAFCIPIWASYITAYGRLKLYSLFDRCHPLYCDTDSVITHKPLNTSDKLGGLKLEHKINEAIFIKPKMYAYKTDNKSKVRIKGLGIRLNYNTFVNDFLINPKWSYTKYIKFKEALRRGLTPNEIIDITKEFSLEDSKRIWKGSFSVKDLQSSKPHFIKDGVTEVSLEDAKRKILQDNIAIEINRTSIKV